MVDACGAGTVVEVEGDGTEKHTCTETSGKNVMLSASVTAGASPAEWAWGLTGSVGIAESVADKETDTVIKAVTHDFSRRFERRHGANFHEDKIVLSPVPSLSDVACEARTLGECGAGNQREHYPGGCS